jgi:hypothetical protein
MSEIMYVMNNKITINLLEEEEEKDEILFFNMLPNKRKSTNVLLVCLKGFFLNLL